MYIIIVLHNISSVNVGVVWEADGDGGCGVIARHQDVGRHRREVTEGPLHHLKQCSVQLPVRALHLHHRLHHDTVVTVHLQTIDQRLRLHCPSAVDPLAFVVIDVDVVWVLFEASRGQEVVDVIVCDRSAIGVLWQGPGDHDGGRADPLRSEVQDNCWLWRGGGGNGETMKGKRWRLGEGTVFRRKKKKKKKRERERERERYVLLSCSPMAVLLSVLVTGAALFPVLTLNGSTVIMYSANGSALAMVKELSSPSRVISRRSVELLLWAG